MVVTRAYKSGESVQVLYAHLDDHATSNDDDVGARKKYA